MNNNDNNNKNNFQVLHVFEDIKKKSTSDTGNLSVCQLYCCSLSEVLESLEQQVNNTLLRLVLEVSLFLVLFQSLSLWFSGSKDIVSVMKRL
jgi:hypothetical protein